MPWVFNLAYAVLIAAALPVLLYRRLSQGKYRHGWREKLFGTLPELEAARERVWFHAVSVGEALLLRGVIAELRSRRPETEIVVTTTTETGQEVARKQYPFATVCYFPLDFTWAVRRALGRIKPTAIVLAELEVWPNLIEEATRRGVRLAIVNGRLSEKSFRGYRRIRPIVARSLRRIDLIAAQSDEYATRFRELGAVVDRVVVTGSVKFDGAQTDRGNPLTAELRAAFGIGLDEVVFIAGSTQDPEEELAIAAWQELRKDVPQLRLILVPRHKERFEEVAALLRRRGLPLLRRSLAGPAVPAELDSRVRNPAGTAGPTKSVLLLDTLGELGGCWGLADVAFVGGSLTNRGGQNMIEPAAYGAAVLFGPNTRNFRDAVELLLAERGARVVASGTELTEQVRGLILDRSEREAMGRRARAAVFAHRGAKDRTIELLVNQVLRGADIAKIRKAA